MPSRNHSLTTSSPLHNARLNAISKEHYDNHDHNYDWNHIQSDKIPDIDHGMGEGPPKNHSTFVGPLKGLNIQTLITFVLLGLLGLFVGLACVLSALHTVKTGHVGLYYKYGALMDDVTQPGIHWMQPFVTEMVALRLTPETEIMNPMVCTTRDGVRNVFRDVQVITSLEEKYVHQLVKRFTSDLKNILVYDRVRESVEKFCANNTIDEVYRTRFLDITNYVNESIVEALQKFAPNGLKLWNVFLPKPDVPPAIAANYRQVKVEWTQQLVAQQKQRTERIRKETENIKAILDAERGKNVEAIRTAQHIEQEEGRSNVTRIRNEVYEETEKLKADVSSYVQASSAKSNEKLLTDNYVKLNVAKMLSNNTKMYFSGGDSLLGASLSKIFGGVVNPN